MLERIRSHQFKVIKALDWEKEDKDFVPLRGSWNANSENDFELDKEVQNFLSSQKKVLLLLGYSGGGKSFYTKKLALSCWENCAEGSSTPVPIWISLPSLKDPIHQAIQEIFQAMGFVADEIETLRQTQSFLFILDGYDEIHDLKNLYVGNQLSHWQAKVMITCRREYLYSLENYASFFIPFKNERPLRAAYSEIIIQPFNLEQIAHYGKQFIQNRDIKTEWSSCYHTIEEIPGLKQLIAKPFMMRLAMEALPSLMEHYQSASTLTRQQLTQARLYDVFVEQWFIRQEEKLKLGQHIGQNEAIKTEFWSYAKSLAKAMYEAGKSEVFYSGEASTLFDTEINDPWKKFFNPQEPRLKLLRTGCLVEEVSLHHYAFMHPSLIEYFLTRGLFDSALIPEKKDIPEAVEKPVKIIPQIPETPSHSNLNQHFLVKDVNIIQFLADRVWEESTYKDFLFDQVYASKNNPRMSTAASNAITILNYARVTLSGMDFSGVNIPEANLENAILYNTNLSCANLTNVNLRRSVLENATFSKTILKNIQFDEQLGFTGESDDPFQCLSFDPKGGLLAVGSARGWIHIWDVQSGDRLRTIKATEGEEVSRGYWIGSWVKSICFSLDGKWLASGGGFAGGGDTAVRIWDVQSGSLLQKFNQHTQEVNSLNFSPDGKYLAIGSRDHQIHIVNLVDCNIDILQGHTESVNSVCFSPDGHFMLSGSDDHTIRIWKLDAGSYKTIDILQDKNGVEGRVSAITFNQEGTLFASTCEKIIHLWDFAGRGLIDIFADDKSDKSDMVTAIDFSPDQQLLVSSTYKGKVNVWNIADKALSYQLAEESSPCTGVRFYSSSIVSEGYTVAVGVLSGMVKFIKTHEKPRAGEVEGHEGAIESIAYHPERKLLISGGQDGATILWDLQNRSIIRQIKHDKFAVVTQVCLDIGGNLLAIGLEKGGLGGDSVIEVWDIKRNEVLHRLSHIKHSRVCGLAFTHDGAFLMSCGWMFELLNIWDMQNGNLMNSLEVPEKSNVLSGCRSLCLSPKGNLLAVGTRSKIYIWDIANIDQKQLYFLTGHSDSIESLAFNPEGTMLASGSWDGTVGVWSIAATQGNLLYKLQSHKSRVESVCFSPDGNWLVSGGQTTHIWDIKTKKSISHFVGHKNKIRGGIKFINTNQFITGCWDHALRIWEVKIKEGDAKVSLEWMSHSIGLALGHVDITGVTELSGKNRKLLERHGAVDRDLNFRKAVEQEMFKRFPPIKSKLENLSKNDDPNFSLNPLPPLTVELEVPSIVMELAFSPDGKWLASATTEKVTFGGATVDFPGATAIYEFETRALFHKFPIRHNKGIYAVDFHPKKNWFAAGEDKGVISLWDIENKQLIHTFLSHSKERVHSISFHPNGKWLAAGCEDAAVRVWDIENGEVIHAFQKNDHSQIWQVLFDPTGKWLAAVDRNLIYLFDMENFELVHTFQDPTKDRIICLAFHPTGKWLASGPGNVNRNDKSIRLWDIQQRKLIKKFQGPMRIVRSVAFHPSGKWLAAGAMENTIYLWNINKKDPIHTFDWQDEAIHDVLFHPKEGDLMAVGGRNVIRRWQIKDSLEETHEFQKPISNLESENESTSEEEDVPNLNSGGELQLFLQMLQAMSAKKHVPQLKTEDVPLVGATKLGQKDVVEKLLQEGCPVDQVNSDGSTALCVAAFKGNIDLMFLLLKAKANVNHADKNGNTPLLLAVGQGHIEAVKILLVEGSQVNQINNPREGITPLYLAVLKGFTEIVKLLLVAKADVTLADKNGNTALLIAVGPGRGNKEIIELLLGANSSVVHVNHEGLSALFLSVLYHGEEIIALLLKTNCNVNQPDQAGNTALLLAVAKESLKIVELLVDAHAAVNQANNKGMTPLMMAVQKGNLEIVQCLLTANADPNRSTARPTNDESSKQNLPKALPIIFTPPAQEKVVKENEMTKGLTSGNLLNQPTYGGNVVVVDPIPTHATQKSISAELTKNDLPAQSSQPIVFAPPVPPFSNKQRTTKDETTKLLNVQSVGNSGNDLGQEGDEEESCCQCTLF